jgi:hypothetical protein
MANDQRITVDDYLRLPWTIRVTRNDEDGYLVARVAELPDVIVTAANEKELDCELWASLRASVECRLHFGDEVPAPARDPDAVNAPVLRHRSHRTAVLGEAWGQSATTEISGSVTERELAMG